MVLSHDENNVQESQYSGGGSGGSGDGDGGGGGTDGGSSSSNSGSSDNDGGDDDDDDDGNGDGDGDGDSDDDDDDDDDNQDEDGAKSSDEFGELRVGSVRRLACHDWPVVASRGVRVGVRWRVGEGSSGGESGVVIGRRVGEPPARAHRDRQSTPSIQAEHVEPTDSGLDTQTRNLGTLLRARWPSGACTVNNNNNNNNKNNSSNVVTVVVVPYSPSRVFFVLTCTRNRSNNSSSSSSRIARSLKHRGHHRADTWRADYAPGVRNKKRKKKREKIPRYAYTHTTTTHEKLLAARVLNTTHTTGSGGNFTHDSTYITHAPSLLLPCPLVFYQPCVYCTSSSPLCAPAFPRGPRIFVEITFRLIGKETRVGC